MAEKSNFGFQVMSQKEADKKPECCLCHTEGNDMTIFPVWTSGPWRDARVKQERPDPLKTIPMCMPCFKNWDAQRSLAFEKYIHPKWPRKNTICCHCNTRGKQTRTVWIKGVHIASKNQLPFSVSMCLQCEADWEGRKVEILKAMYIGN